MLPCEVADFFERRANTTAIRPFAMGISAIRRMKSGDVTCSTWLPAGNSSPPRYVAVMCECRRRTIRQQVHLVSGCGDGGDAAQPEKMAPLIARPRRIDHVDDTSKPNSRSRETPDSADDWERIARSVAIFKSGAIGRRVDGAALARRSSWPPSSAPMSV